MACSRTLLAALALTAAGALLVPPPAHATLIDLGQEWRDPLFASEGQSLTTQARVDTSGLTGAGTEQAPLTSLVLVEYLFGIGQNVYQAVLSDPPDLSVTGNIGAEFTNGVFTGRLFTKIPSGSGNTLLLNLSTGMITAVAIFGGGLVNYGTVLFLNEYLLFSTTTQVVPEPSLLLLTGLALAWAARPGRRH